MSLWILEKGFGDYMDFTEYLLHNFKLHWRPKAEIVEYYDTGYSELIVVLDNGMRLLYDDDLKTTRRLSNDPINMDDDQYCVEVGHRLRSIIRKKRVTQHELSEKTGISPVTISKYINGKACPTLATIHKIARAMDCPVEDLIRI